MAEHSYDYDLFVIGGGSGGVRAARVAAATGAKVALAEEYPERIHLVNGGRAIETVAAEVLEIVLDHLT